MEKVYLIYRNVFTESFGDTHTFKVFKTLDEAREYYDDLVDDLTNDYDGVVDICDIGTDCCEFYNEGEFPIWHDVIMLKVLSY